MKSFWRWEKEEVRRGEKTSAAAASHPNTSGRLTVEPPRQFPPLHLKPASRSSKVAQVETLTSPFLHRPPTKKQKTNKKTALFCYRSRSTPSSLLLSAAAQVRPKKSNTIRVSVCDRTVPLVRPSRRKTLLLQRHVFTGINVPAPYC